MKRNFIFTLAVGIICYIVLSSNNAGYGGNATGSTGASGCSCHGATNSLLPVSIVLDSNGTAVNKYTPGGNYTIKMVSTNNTTVSLPKFGFQLSSVLAKGTAGGTGGAAGGAKSSMAGSWGSPLPTSVANVTLGGANVISHTTAISATTGTGGNGSTYSISIPWKAPKTGSGAVVLYGVIAAVNGNGSDKGDYTNLSKTLYIPERGKESICK